MLNMEEVQKDNSLERINNKESFQDARIERKGIKISQK